MRRLVSLLLFILAALPASAQQPRNVIYFITDGFGPASVTFARDYAKHTQGREVLAFDTLLVGAARTWSTNSRVTDSAAGATALATGHKSYNGAIGVDTLKRPLATVLEGAARRGMATGLVVTTRITHATPAGFSAHVEQRAMENEIAEQQAALGIDLLMGGGRRQFLPTEAGGKRTDGRDLIAEMQAQGYTVASTKAELEALASLPAIALLRNNQLEYEIDRDPAREPSLAEMTVKALELLSQHKDGFFVMVEASRIDHAAHENDAAAHVHDILAFDEAIAAAVRWAQQDGNTLVLSTSDHETGGLTVGRAVNGRGVYRWEPELLVPIKASQMVIADRILKGADADSLLAADMGLTDLTEDDREMLTAAIAKDRPQDVSYAISEILGRRAIIGWTTDGHTGVDVNIYAYGPGYERFRGNMDNNVVAQHVADLLGLDLDALTQELRARSE